MVPCGDQFAFPSFLFVNRQAVRQARKLLLEAEQDLWFLELQPHWKPDTTSEPQNRKLNTQFTKKAALCPSRFPGILQCRRPFALSLSEPFSGKGADVAS